MRLSDLVRMANGADPEVLVYEEDAGYWAVRRTSGESVVLTGDGLVLATDRSVCAVSGWNAGGVNPFSGAAGVLPLRPAVAP